MEQKEYIKKLENVVKQMMNPLKDIPFSLIIKSLSDFKVIPFDYDNKKDKQMLNKLKKAAKLAGEKINKKGIVRKRANEVGNDVESFVKTALNKTGFKAGIPTTKKGAKKASGYPDIEFKDQSKRINYLECKTYNKKTINTTQRSFYFSPSKKFKITENAHHLVIAYQIYVDGRKGESNIYKTKGWKIIDICDLPIDLKYEFQSDNKRLYSKTNILQEGTL